MFTATPLVAEGDEIRPRVVLLDMTANPLRLIGAVSELYDGRVVEDPSTVSRETVMRWINGFKQSRISAPLEWVNLSLFISGVTRAFTHQLVRQRTAVYVQESMRFAVKENAAFEVALPPSIAGEPGDSPLRAEWEKTTRSVAASYNRLVNAGMPAEDARGLLPTNIGTRVHYHTDLRNLISQSGNRLCSQAQQEWKQVWIEIIRAIIAYGPKEERWQQREIASLFKPICYQTGKCEFMGPADRFCSIRDRVEAHHANGDRPDTWTDIDPHEPLHPLAARKPL
jgi:flavin-dependent thymidylate synthase